MRAILADWNDDDPDIPVTQRDSYWFKQFFSAVFRIVGEDKNKQLTIAQSDELASTWLNCRRVHDFMLSDVRCQQHEAGMYILSNDVITCKRRGTTS